MNLVRTSPLLLLTLMASRPAVAGFEGQGAPLPPSSGELDDPALSWSVAPVRKGSGSVDVVAGFADAPLARRAADGSVLAELDNVVSLRLGGRYALSDRVELGLSLPVVLSFGSDLLTDGGAPALGDLRASGRIGLTAPSSPVHLGVLPELRLPTGASAYNLGDDGIGGHVLIAGTLEPGPLRLSASVGPEWRTFEATGNAEPGLGVLANLAVGVQPRDDLAVAAEWRFAQRLARSPLASAPDGFIPAARGGEALLTLRARTSSETTLGGGVGLGAPWGFSAARARAFLGFTARFGADPVAAEARRERRETRKEPVQAVAPVPVIVSVQDEAGVPLDASLTVDGGGLVQATSGRARLSLPPGEHRVDVAVEGYGPQARELDLEPGLQSPEQVRFILLPRAGDGVVFVDLGNPEDEPVVDATLSIDGRPVGQSASGGGVLVGGLGAEPVVFEARAPALRSRTLTLTPQTAPEPVELLLARERGAVQLVVTDPRGNSIPDVRARFLGPDSLGPYNLGERARRTFVLRPGSWQVLVSHKEHGLQQRGVDLLDEDSELSVVHVVLQPPESGRADLDLRVVDPAGEPVEGAEIRLDGVSLGYTSSAGTLHLDDLAEGARQVSVLGEDLVPVTRTLDLYDGLQEHLLVAGWRPGATLFRARGPQGMAADAKVRGQGPEPLAALPLGKDGVLRTTLQPGAWDLLFSSPSLGLAQQSAEVPAEAGTLTVVDAMIGEEDAPGTTLAVRVTDPESAPVSGALVRLDGEVVGRTTRPGMLSITDAGQGSRELQVEAAPYAVEAAPVRLSGDKIARDVRLRWAPGAVRVAVRRGGEPVPGATVRIGGERFIPPTPVGTDGRKLFSLSPGEWQVLVSAPELGLQQVALQVPERAQLTEISVDLDPVDPDAAQTIVRVQGPDGRPIEKAEVTLDDRAPVQASGGFAAFTDVEDGPHRLSITAPDFEEVVVDDVQVKAGTSQRIVPLTWVPRELPIRIVGPEDDPVAARIVAIAPEARQAIGTGADGQALLDLDPRAWELLVRAEGLRVARVQVPEGASTEPIEVQLQPARVRVDGAVLTTDVPIYFQTGKATLGPASLSLLDEVADTLVAHPELVRVEIGGHTDATGSVQVNMRLSRQRAEAVAAALIERGVAPERLDPQGYGPTRPTASNDTEEGRAENRRVEFVSETDSD